MFVIVDQDALVDHLHTLPTRAVIITTGGGTEIFKILLHRGGGSATLISGLIPYNEEDTIELLGYKPDKLVSEETTRALAMVAFQKALPRRSHIDDPVIGLATSSILQRTPTEREGREHYIYAALQTATQTISLTLQLTPDPASTPVLIRQQEETLNANVLLNLLARGSNSKYRVAQEHAQAHTTVNQSALDPIIADLLLGKRKALAFDCNGDTITVVPDAPQSDQIIFPGSFNPFHDAHRYMEETISKQQSQPVSYEISLVNVDKPNLDLITITERLRQFRSNKRVWITTAPTFVEKAKLFPHSTFIIGYDTATRICDTKYAGSLEQVFNQFKFNNTKFIVFPREIDTILHDKIDQLPQEFTQFCTMTTTKPEYINLSSTDIRKMTKPL